MERVDEGRVVATASPSRTLRLTQTALWSTMTVFYLLVGLVMHRGMYVAFGIVAGTFSILWITIGIVEPTVRLRLTTDELIVQRWLRPYRIHRADVVRLHGNIDGRPEWSANVIVETTSGRRKLPSFTERPAQLLPILEAWVTAHDPAQQAP
ncbi:hypothetical protein [Cellulomonas sp. URHE0023]|uniref:hypothetical protein n=1 Tax=Cellulomonas sp. URHE0023 TaxID=1380354 RepID=UPI000481091A|nr:hypothetical protein [Cellulomonas sp. URHE0023]